MARVRNEFHSFLVNIYIFIVIYKVINNVRLYRNLLDNNETYNNVGNFFSWKLL